jgi:hypothetical protein
LARAYNQEWKQILRKIGQKVKRLDSQEWDDMEAYNYNGKEKRVYYLPYTLDPEKPNFEDCM